MSFLVSLALFFLVFSLLNAFGNAANLTSVCLNDGGCILGKVEKGNKESYEAYYGIPFAEPPTGQRRFKDPVPRIIREDVWNATYPRSPCIQRESFSDEISGSEDCLYLNLYRPLLTKAKKQLPVIVFFHGGGFQMGTSNPDFYAPDYFMDTLGVVVVNVAYRLGVFGFLAANHESVKGNYGLKDQNLALAWIHTNIEAFGGDPLQVTVTGQSSGAASVQYQMMSKLSNGYFQRAVMMSGSALAYWALNKQPLKQFRDLATIAGIPGAKSDDPSTIVQELRKRSAHELFRFQEALPTAHVVVPVFRPVVEGNWLGAFITEDPEKIWKSGRYEQRPFLIGVTGYEEGSFSDLYYDENRRTSLLAHWETFMSTILEMPFPALKPLIDLYFDGRLTEANAINMLKLRSRMADFPMYKTVDYYTEYANLTRNPVDLYRFNFTTNFSLSFFTNPYPILGRGASHTDDLMYLFKSSRLDHLLSKEIPEMAMKDFWVRFMVDYATNGRDAMDTKRCCRSDMRKGICEYTDIQRDFSRTPNGVRITTSSKIDMDDIEANRAVDRLMRSFEEANAVLASTGSFLGGGKIVWLIISLLTMVSIFLFHVN